MPVSDKNHYNMKRMRILFACSSLALLASVAWLIKVDHDRPWRTCQDEFTALQASLAKTTWETGNPRAPRCVPTGADDPGEGNPPIGCLGDCTPLPAPTRRAAACCA